MHRAKSLLLGTAAALVAMAGAQAADMPVKGKPVQYVKICSLYGDGFYYIPGTDTCLKLGGYVRVQAEYNMGAGGIAVGTNAVEDGQARFTRDLTNDVNYRVRAVSSWDVRQETEYGTLRTYIRFGAENTTPAQTGGGTTFSPYWDRAFMQFAGFTVGRARSFFDIFGYFGTFTYTTPRATGDTDFSGQNLWAYSASLGNGVSATLSLEDPTNHKAFTFDATAPGFFGLNGTVVPDNAFSNNAAGAAAVSGFGFRVPDVVGNLRVDQAWGYAGVSVALHDASGAYYGTPNSTVNGHPADRYGWAAATGFQLNMTGGDRVGVNFAYGEGATGFVASATANLQLYNSNTSVGAGWLSDGVFTTGTAVELTRAWSINAAYEHVWNPHWRTSLYGGYASIAYNGTATGIINSSLAAGSVCARPFAGLVGNFSAVTAFAGNSCSPDFSFYQVGSRTQWNPVRQLDIGLDVTYTGFNTAYKGAGIYAVNASRPAVTLFDDQGAWSTMVRWQRNFYP
jgi:Porin subfamily